MYFFEESYKKCANFESFESAFNMKSVSMPLILRTRKMNTSISINVTKTAIGCKQVNCKAIIQQNIPGNKLKTSAKQQMIEITRTMDK